jgi:hypothetical protein
MNDGFVKSPHAASPHLPAAHEQGRTGRGDSGALPVELFTVPSGKSISY